MQCRTRRGAEATLEAAEAAIVETAAVVEEAEETGAVEAPYVAARVLRTKSAW